MQANNELIGVRRFPKYTKLNGTDYFLLFQDRLQKNRRLGSNTCTVFLYLDALLSKKRLEKRLEQEELVLWLSRLSLTHRIPFQRAFWQAHTFAARTIVREKNFTEENLGLELLVSEVRASLPSESPISFNLFHINGKKTILGFTWDHTIMDAHGAETLLLNLSQEPQDLDPDKLLGRKGPKNHSLNFRSRLIKAREAKDFIKSQTKGDLVQFSGSSIAKESRCIYMVLNFNADECSKIEESSDRYGAGFRKSNYYISAIAKNLLDVLKNRGESTNNKSFLIPVPQDRRKRGARLPILTNQVSFMFYRIPTEIVENGLSSTIMLLNEQMKVQIKNQMNQSYADLMDWFSILPMPIYQKVIASPSKGMLSSFNFSDVGESVLGFSEFLSTGVNDAIHVPPNNFPPGITIVFMKLKNRIKIILSAYEPVINAAELEHFAENFRKTLCGQDESCH